MQTRFAALVSGLTLALGSQAAAQTAQTPQPAQPARPAQGAQPAQPAQQAAGKAFTFAADKEGAPPAGYTCARTGPGKMGDWKVVADTNGAGPKRLVLAQLDPDTTSARFPVCVRDDVTVKDADISVKFKAISGSEDQAAGIVWRYRDPNNYYIVRANALEDNVVLYKVEKGKRIDLPLVGKGKTYGAKALIPKKQWSTLRVTAAGDLFTVFLNGAKLYEVQDKTFTDAGKVGVWTKADSVMYFDELTVAAGR
jgi:hypothetical protein